MNCLFKGGMTLANKICSGRAGYECGRGCHRAFDVAAPEEKFLNASGYEIMV